MAEITFGKSIKSTNYLAAYRYAEEFIDLPDAEDFVEYQYAKNFLNHPENAKIIEMSLAEMLASVDKTSRPEESFPSYLLADSQEAQWAWDALNLIAQDWLRKGKPLHPEAAEWIADVLADQLVEKEPKRRPRPRGRLRSQHPRDLFLCMLVDQLVCLFDLHATRNDSAPPRSACDVVAAAEGLSYKSVEGIWNNRDPRLEPLFSEWNKQALLERFLCPD